MKKIFLLFTILFSLNTEAALLTPEGSSGTIEKISLPESVTVSASENNLKLSSLGSAMRAKKVMFVNVKVYVGQIFVADKGAFNKSDALNSLSGQSAAAIQLHFVRDVDAENVQASFKEALKVNKVNLESEAITQFLTAVKKGGVAKSGKTLTILAVKSPESAETISYETNDGTVTEIKGPAGFTKDIFSIWLGTPSDDGVAKFKSDILKK